MRKSVLAKVQRGTSEHVILHAKFQRSRGRNPSMSFRGILNPREALKLAIKEHARDSWLNFDGIAFAEKLMGVSYKENEDAAKLGMFMSISGNKIKKNILEDLDDTAFGTSLDEYLRIAQEEGFEIVLKEPFLGRGFNGKSVKETLFILFHKADGILLRFDTYQGNGVNGGDFYYNWIPKGEHNWKVLSSGGYSKIDGELIWIGHHDCREALRCHISKLRDYGTFVPSWKEQPFLWLLHYMDTKDPGYDYKKINAERIAALPKFVQSAIRV